MALTVVILTVDSGYALPVGWRWRRSIGVGPFRYTLSKRGIGYSVGVPGCRVSTTPDGRRYLVLSVPGTGFAWWKRLEDRSVPNPPVGGTAAPQGPSGRKGKGLPPGVGRGGRMTAVTAKTPSTTAPTSGKVARPIIQLREPNDT